MESNDATSGRAVSPKQSIHNNVVSQGPQTPQNRTLAAKDAEGIALLRQIFPSLSDAELQNLHKNHVKKSSKKPTHSEQEGPSSRLGQRIWKQAMWFQEHAEIDEPKQPLHWRQTELADDFLRLPPDIAIRRHNPRENKWHYMVIQTLEQQVLEQHIAHQHVIGTAVDYPVDELKYTRVLFRDPQKGLGMTLCEEGGRIWVHSLIGRDGSRWFVPPPEHEKGGPSMEAGIMPGDWLLGINGQALLPLPSSSEENNLLKDAVSAIQFSPDPVVLHLRRVPPHRLHPLVERTRFARSISLNGPALLQNSVENPDSTIISETSSSHAKSKDVNNGIGIHPFVSVLASKNLIQSMKDQVEATKTLSHFTDRARQWESFSSFRIHANSFQLKTHIDPKDLPPSMNADTLPFQSTQAKNVRPWAPSTPMLDPERDSIPEMYMHGEIVRDPPLDEDDPDEEAPMSLLSGKPFERVSPRSAVPLQLRGNINTQRRRAKRAPVENSDGDDVIFIPLMNVRKALCCRILNSFTDNNRTAYTIWVYDVESGREWYAPVRYMKDFQLLRSSTAPLCQRLNHLSFPTVKWTMFGNSETSEPPAVKEVKSRQLETFLRTLCSIIYTDPLHPSVAEIAIHVQSFLGCDAGLSSEDLDLHLQSHVTLNESMGSDQSSEEGHSELQMKFRFYLKSSIQRYTFRLLLLDVVETIIRQFVEATRAKGPTLQDIEGLEAKGRSVIKERAMMDLERIQAFLDQFQDLILDGCMADFESISRRRAFFPLHTFLEGTRGNVYLERVVREAVREQLEIEVYVPLRTMVSRYLVHGWRHDDMEIHFKMNELRKRPQSMFRIPIEKQSPSDWRSVSSILNEGAQQTTLPCGKLRAIVHAANEITRIYAEERRFIQDSPPLGADDFLPIFIYCVVQAGMERPCALTVLLRTLCEPTNRIGEIGYYLASFEAAIMHIQEIDLTDD